MPSLEFSSRQLAGPVTASLVTQHETNATQPQNHHRNEATRRVFCESRVPQHCESRHARSETFAVLQLIQDTAGSCSIVAGDESWLPFHLSTLSRWSGGQIFGGVTAKKKIGLRDRASGRAGQESTEQTQARRARKAWNMSQWTQIVAKVVLQKRLDLRGTLEDMRCRFLVHDNISPAAHRQWCG